MRSWIRAIAMLLLAMTLLLTPSCVSTQLVEGDRLIRHPQFKAAAIAAPDWTKEALRTVDRLEYQLKAKQ